MTNIWEAVGDKLQGEFAKDDHINAIWDDSAKEMVGVMWEVDVERLLSLAETFLQVIQDRETGDTPDDFQNRLPF